MKSISYSRVAGLLGILGLLGTSGCAKHGVVNEDQWKASIAPVFAEREAAIRECYGEVLKKYPKAEGFVSVDFVVRAGDGVIENMVPAGSAFSPPKELEECVYKNVGAMGERGPVVVRMRVVSPDKREMKASWVWRFTRYGIGVEPKKKSDS